MVEQMLFDLGIAESRWNIAILRYFNPVGAHPSGLIGEEPRGVPNNLFPYVSQVALGKLKELSIFGIDYDTFDGTGVRDYIHVMDLAEAHVCAVKRLIENKQNEAFEVFNIGTGTGSSVLEVIQTFERVNQVAVPHTIGPRRAGDVVQVWAETTKVESILGWKAKRDLAEMLKDAWNWQKKLS